MPSSPVYTYIKKWDNNTESLEKFFIPDEATNHYYSVWFESGSPVENAQAYLMCCPMEEKPCDTDNWYHVEELQNEHKSMLELINNVFGVDFTKNTFGYFNSTKEYLLKFGCDTCGKKTEKGYSDMGGGWCYKCYNKYLNG